MLRYSLSKIGRSAGRAKGTKAELPPIEPRLSTEREYYAALRAMLTQMAKETRESVIPLYQAETAQKRSALTGDAEPIWFNRLAAVTAMLQRVATDTVNRILNLEAVRHTEAFMTNAKRALGIDLRSVVRQEDLADYLQAAAGRNASLITSLGDDTIKRIQQAVYDNSIAGNSVATLRKALADGFGISDRRAKLIARDQTGKLNADLNQIRQTQAGVEEYGFMTSVDERVRASHDAMQGRTCRWSDPTVYKATDGSWRPRSGVGGVEKHAGQDIQCRCVGRGIVVF